MQNIQIENISLAVQQPGQFAFQSHFEKNGLRSFQYFQESRDCSKLLLLYNQEDSSTIVVFDIVSRSFIAEIPITLPGYLFIWLYYLQLLFSCEVYFMEGFRIYIFLTNIEW